MRHEKHLKDRSYYEDQYDRYTVERCRRHEKYYSEIKDENKIKEEFAKKVVSPISLHFLRGERYANREDTINEWMERDRKRDEFYENTHPPTSIRCKFCEEEMELLDKRLDIDYKDNEKDKVIFIFQCKECKVAKEFNGKVLVKDIIPWKCPKCSGRLKTTNKNTKNKIYCKKVCDYCGYKDEYELDLRNNEFKKKEPTKAEIKQFNIDKDRFCLSDKEGMRYLSERTALNTFSEMQKEKEYKEIEKLKFEKLTLPSLEKLLIKELKNKGYFKLSFEDPDTTRDVMIRFKVQDEREREEYKSKKDLKKLLNEILKDTNWRLMSEGIEYKLGILTGRLRGYESKEDFYKNKNINTSID